MAFFYRKFNCSLSTKYHKTYARQYADLYKIYPRAEKELAKHYSDYFGYDHPTAAKLAKLNIDLIYRGYFIFHKRRTHE